MLQQTQIATVIPYYRRFLRAFPTLKRLAKAPLERVLELWSGLGYYRRARHLHAAARMISRKFAGRLPADYSQLRSLPGVGDYTARALLSIAFNQHFPALDGNVARVVARLKALKGNLQQPHFRRAVERELELLLSRREPGNFNQALMELGQTVCLPRAPSCPACLLRRWCKAYLLGRPEAYPAPRPRRSTEFRHLAAAVIRRNSSVAMVRGLDESLLGDLWNFPAAFGASRAQAKARLEEKLRATLGGRFPLKRSLGELRHDITFRSIRVHPFEVPGSTRANGVRWVELSRLNDAAVSQLARKIAARIETIPQGETR